MEAEKTPKKEIFEQKTAEEERPEVYSPVEREYHAPEGSAMKITSLIFAVISLIGVLALAYTVYDMSGRLNALTDAQGAGQSNFAADLGTLKTAAKQQEDDSAKLATQVQQNIGSLEALKAETKQNTAAIDDMKTRINRLIDLIK